MNRSNIFSYYYLREISFFEPFNFSLNELSQLVKLVEIIRAMWLLHLILIEK
jgi:hypothetical protein